ncbi:hypothetical protein [Rhodococcus koreensis]
MPVGEVDRGQLPGRGEALLLAELHAPLDIAGKGCVDDVEAELLQRPPDLTRVMAG